ncbi:PKD domain-containing protein [Carboxylicivirga sp. A043]|uniref:PKD domain-containing protein n=1 Tax=Carboxylicivirga litoralis TaxID=2816963 RepID=UPI0021CB07B7|nr:PKD domain-containing protein [Carboxylicivirga sp. A043]MCU4157103.1 PKD domain-containing protein [Carboxylicivirga sp. A043]
MKIIKRKWLQRSKLLLMVGAIAGMLSACGDDVTYLYKENSAPEADFSVLVNDMEVSFTNKTVSATSFAWDFGDGTTSDLQSPDAHIYMTEGVYMVALKVTDNNGLESTFEKNVSVPYLEFTTSDVDFGTVQFNNNDRNGDAFEWDFGDGVTSTEENPVHTYAIGGYYQVKLVVKKSGAVLNSYAKEVVPQDAEFLDPWVTNKAWEGYYSTSTGSNVGDLEGALEGTQGMKLDADGKNFWQQIRVFKDAPYRLSFWLYVKKDYPYAQISVYDAEGYDENNLEASTLIARVGGPDAPFDYSSSAYVLQSFDFATTGVENIIVRGDYLGYEARYTGFNITPVR